jgi:hypothetical protein
MRRVFALWVLWGAFVATSSGPLPGAEFLQYLTEKRHFLLSASRHFENQMWVDYQGALFFRPTTAEAVDLAKAIRESRERYVAFTNISERDEIRLKVLQDSGISPRYLKQLTTPTDPTNAVPVLHGKRLRLLRGCALVQSFENGDAVIKVNTSDPETLYVYQYGALAQNGDTGVLVVPEELKAYQNNAGLSETVMAYRRVDLTEEDKAALLKIRTTCARFAAQLESAMDAVKKPSATLKPPQNLRLVP